MNINVDAHVKFYLCVMIKLCTLFLSRTNACPRQPCSPYTHAAQRNAGPDSPSLSPLTGGEAETGKGPADPFPAERAHERSVRPGQEQQGMEVTRFPFPLDGGKVGMGGATMRNHNPHRPAAQEKAIIQQENGTVTGWYNAKGQYRNHEVFLKS